LKEPRHPGWIHRSDSRGRTCPFPPCKWGYRGGPSGVSDGAARNQYLTSRGDGGRDSRIGRRGYHSAACTKPMSRMSINACFNMNEVRDHSKTQGCKRCLDPGASRCEAFLEACSLAAPRPRGEAIGWTSRGGQASLDRSAFDGLLRTEEDRLQPDAASGFGFEQAFLEPACPTARPTGLPTDTVDLATLLGAHGRLRGEREHEETWRCTPLTELRGALFLTKARPIPQTQNAEKAFGDSPLGRGIRRRGRHKILAAFEMSCTLRGRSKGEASVDVTDLPSRRPLAL